MEYGLYFERFLNPERVSMPDIDIDFCIRRRQEVIDYVNLVAGSLSGTSRREKPGSRSRTILTASSRMVRLRRPRKLWRSGGC